MQQPATPTRNKIHRLHNHVLTADTGERFHHCMAAATLAVSAVPVE
jgi:hypothetical protein